MLCIWVIKLLDKQRIVNSVPADSIDNFRPFRKKIQLISFRKRRACLIQQSVTFGYTLNAKS